jgi:A/G-specific adenine glycosylase
VKTSGNPDAATLAAAENFPSMRLALRAWWKRSKRRFPWRKPGDPYAVFLAEAILQKTQVAKAEKAYAELIAAYPTVEALANPTEGHLDSVFGWLGLVKRAGYLRAAARAMVQRHSGAVPRTGMELMALPGVGQYSANAVLCFAYAQPVPVVDTAIARVLKRVFGFCSEKPAWKDPVAWSVAEAFLDTVHPVEHNYALIDLAALICTPADPQCRTCPLSQWCVSARV